MVSQMDVEDAGTRGMAKQDPEITQVRAGAVLLKK